MLCEEIFVSVRTLSKLEPLLVSVAVTESISSLKHRIESELKLEKKIVALACCGHVVEEGRNRKQGMWQQHQIFVVRNGPSQTHVRELQLHEYRGSGRGRTSTASFQCGLWVQSVQADEQNELFPMSCVRRWKKKGLHDMSQGTFTKTSLNREL